MNQDTPNEIADDLGANDFVPDPPAPRLHILPPPGEWRALATFDSNDIGNANALTYYHGDDMRYCYPWRSWVVWDGTRWKVDDSGEVRRRAEKTLQLLAEAAAKVTDPDKRAAALKWVLTSMTNRRMKDMIEVAQSKLPVTVDSFDRDGFLLNAQNGTIDLRTGELRPHRRDDFITKVLPLEYDATALCPRWNDFLHRTMQGNDDMVSFLHRATGYSLTGSCKEQVMFILHGTGSNGKSTFLDVIGELLSEYAMQIDSETITVKQPGKMANDIARLRGARFVAASETEDGRRLAEAKVKQMTGGDKLVGEFKFQEQFEFTPQFKIWLATNHLPQIRGGGDAIWRRLPLVHFDARFWRAERGETGEDEYRADVNLPAALREEMPGILRWAVEGCKRWQEDGLGQPEEIIRATAEYRAEMDAIAAFVEDCVSEHPTYNVSKSDMYARYKRWAEDAGEFVVSQKALGLKLKERNWPERKTSSGRFWCNKVLIG